MSDTLTLMGALGTGLSLGALFFGGLWWTVRTVTTCRHPALLLLTSFALRASIALVGIYFAFGGHWDRLLACMLGFVIARFVVTRLTAPSYAPHPSAVERPPNASQSG